MTPDVCKYQWPQIFKKFLSNVAMLKIIRKYMYIDIKIQINSIPFKELNKNSSFGYADVLNAK